MVEIRAHQETNSNSGKIFTSSEGGANGPVLSVTYNSYPAVPTGAWSERDEDGAYSLHGTFSDPDGGTGSDSYTVTRDDTGQVVTGASGFGQTVASGSDSASQIPGGVIEDDVGYHFTARAFDGIDYSASTPSQVLYKDTCPDLPFGVVPPATHQYKTFINDLGQPVSLYLDEYRPPGTGVHPALFMVHGAGWTGGCRRTPWQLAETYSHDPYDFDVLSVDYRLACLGNEHGYHQGVLVLCKWPYQMVENGRKGVAAQDVEDAIGYLKGGTFSAWDGTHIAAWGGSAGGTVLLEADADAHRPGGSGNAPQVTATWSAMMEFGNMQSVPTGDGLMSADSCDHAKGYFSDPYDGGRMDDCWTGENHYMDFLHTQVLPYCGFDHLSGGQLDGEVDPQHTDISGNPSPPDTCTTDDADWANASPYTEWLNQNATEAVYGPVFMANGGGPYDPAHPEQYQYKSAETEAVTDAYDFKDLLLDTLHWGSSNLDLCIVDTPKHATEYQGLPCEGDPQGATVLDDTAAFISAHLPP